MALRQAKIQPTLQEKRYIILQFLEASYVSGNEVNITPVKAYGLTSLSGEEFVYDDTIGTYIIFDERPKVSLLKKLGWYREDSEIKPILAYMPTHLLYNKETGEVVNEVLLDGTETSQLVKTGESENYILKDLKVIRGTIVDIFYDFLSEKLNKFYVADVKVDTISINYIANLVPYKNNNEGEAPDDSNRSNNKFLNVKTEEVGL